jgi:hypothetical protein
MREDREDIHSSVVISKFEKNGLHKYSRSSTKLCYASGTTERMESPAHSIELDM